MGVGTRTAALGVVAAGLLAGSSVGASTAFGAPPRNAPSHNAPSLNAPSHNPKNAVVFEAAHIAGVKGKVLTEGKGLVVYTFTGDKRGKAGTCAGGCAAIWPHVHGIPVVAHGTKLHGKFGRIDGQVTYNGWPLYLFTGEKSHRNHADSAFKVVSVR